MSSYWKRDPSGTPPEVANRLYKKLFGDTSNALGHTESNQPGADSDGNPAGGSGDSDREVSVMSESQRIGTKRMSDKERLDQALKLWRADLDKMVAENNELLEAVQWAYRKHHLGDDTIGWSELSEKLLDALCNAMGADGYLAWSKPYGRSQED